MHILKIFLVAIVMIGAVSPGGVYSNMEPLKNSDYTVGPGDRLKIQVWGHDDLNRVVEVTADGTFSFPFIGKVQALGKNVFALENILVEKLSDGYLVAPQLSVAVSEYNNKKVFLFGEVVRPGSYILKANMRLLELISDAGGFTAGRGATGTVVRVPDRLNDAKPVTIEDAAGHEIITINLTELTNGDARENIVIVPNDSIYISTADRIFVTGEVKRPGEVEYQEGMTVRQAISKAGGGTPKAAIGRTRIVRMNDGREIEIKPQPGDRILPNDIVKVPESYF
jgi:polysaccharide biosynthesis/export protein